MFKKALSSPAFYTAIGYLTALLSLLAANLVSKEYISLNGVFYIYVSLILIAGTLLGPLLGVIFGLWCSFRGRKVFQSIISIVAALPLLLIWAAVISRHISAWSAVK